MIITRIVHLRLLVLAHLAQAECHGRQCGWCGIFGIGVCSVSVLLYSIDSITSGKATAGCRIAGMTDWGTAAPRYSRKTGIPGLSCYTETCAIRYFLQLPAEESISSYGMQNSLKKLAL